MIRIEWSRTIDERVDYLLCERFKLFPHQTFISTGAMATKGGIRKFPPLKRPPEICPNYH